MSAPWLHIIGVTEQGIELLPTPMADLIAKADHIFGPPRFLDQVQPTHAQIHQWQSPLAKSIYTLKSCGPRPTIVLATGDPNWFGIGATLSRQFADDEFAIYPAPSSFQLAAAHLKWPLQSCKTLSLHGRSAQTILPHLRANAHILALTSNAATLREVATLLAAHAPGSSLTTLEHLGGPDQKITVMSLDEAQNFAVSDFYVLAVHVPPTPTAPRAAPFGLADDLFAHDGQLTKREVRTITLANLAPQPGQTLWDIGAGSGSVAIEWLRQATDGQAHCVEQNPDRADRIAENANALGVAGLHVHQGQALDLLAQLPAPDTIFHGGGVEDDTLFGALWQALPPNGLMVANAVTLEARSALIRRHLSHGGELIDIAISRGDMIVSQTILRPKLPVLQWSVTKGEACP